MSDGVRSVGKAFDLLSAFQSDGAAELPLGVLAAHAHLPKATAHGLVKTLVEERALERTSNGYRLGLRLFELGESVRIKRDLREAALPFLQDLYEATHHTVHLAVLEGTDAIYLERIRGHLKMTIPSSLGGRLPAYCTGVGKALLAGCADAQERLGPGPLKARTPNTITVPAVLGREFDRIRGTGVAIDREEVRVGLGCVAAGIFVDGQTVAALSVSGPIADINVNRLTIAVRAAANGVGRTLASG
jgi:IclR family acetate operon transcriptional repressor